MSRSAIGVLLVLPLAACGQKDAAPETPSVLVSTVTPGRGSLPSVVTAYGSAGPSQRGAVTMSVAQPGEIASLVVTTGSAVRAGQPLLTFALAPAARSAYQQAANALHAAQQQRASTASLLAQQLATRDQLAQADKAVADARSALAALQADGAGQPVRTLTAPFAGVVTAITVAPGDRPQGGAPLLTIARDGAMMVTVGIDPAQRAAVIPGARTHIQRLSDGSALSGRVIRIDGMLNPKTRLVDVDISPTTGVVLPGEGMQVGIETGKVEGWLVPHRSVVITDGPSRIYQVAAGKAKAVTVRILLATDKSDVVDGAIDPSRPIIVDGAYQVNDGDAVRQGQS